jgi:hypothetical protein
VHRRAASRQTEPPNSRRVTAETVFCDNWVVAPLLRATSTVPIVFAQTPDPVGAGASSPAWRGRAAMPPVLQSA